MKRAIIVHCWDGRPDYAWYPWAKVELEKHGYSVQIPQMPHADEPQLREWLPELRKLIGAPDDELLLIGHSLGTVVIMRYLETFPEGAQIGKAIFVAGFTDQLGFKELESFFETRLDFEKIKSKSHHGFVAIQSDNDPFVSAQYGNRLKDELDAQAIIKHNAGHMSGSVDGEAACTELPELLQALEGFEGGAQ